MQTKTTVNKEPLVQLSKRDGMNPVLAFGVRVIAFVLGMLVCGFVASLLIDDLRVNPAKIKDFYYSFINGSFTTERKLWTYFKDIAILLCIALALTPAFRMRFWNTGAEGQTLMGVLAAVGVNFYLGGTYNPAVALPDWALLILMFGAALLAGAIWGLIPALFKALWDTNETLFTLMMNYVAAFVVSFCLIKWVPSGSSSLKKLASGAFPQIFTGLSKPVYSDYLIIILLVLLLTMLLWVYINHSKHGYELNVVGQSLRTASYIGINVKKVIIRTMLLSGLLCGFAGWLIGAGLDRSVTDVSVGGQGFTAIMVAWLAKFDPIMMIITAGLIIFLKKGAAQVSSAFGISQALPEVIIGIVLFFIIGSEFFVNYKIKLRKRAALLIAPVVMIFVEQVGDQLAVIYGISHIIPNLICGLILFWIVDPEFFAKLGGHIKALVVKLTAKRAKTAEKTPAEEAAAVEAEAQPEKVITEANAEEAVSAAVEPEDNETEKEGEQ